MKRFLVLLLVASLPFPGFSACSPRSRSRRIVASASAGTESAQAPSEKERASTQKESRGTARVAHETKKPGRSEKTEGLRPIPAIRATPENGSNGHRPERENHSNERKRPGGWTPATEGERLIADDFDDGLRWKPVSWTNVNDCELSLYSDDADQGGWLSVQCNPGEEGKAAIQLDLPRPLNVAAFDYVSVRAKIMERQGTRGVDLAAAFQTQGYYESSRIPLKQGSAREFRISLDREDYKTSPDWEYSSRLRGRQGVKTIYLLIYYQESCRIGIDTIYFGREGTQEPDGPGSAAAPPEEVPHGDGKETEGK